MRVCLALKLAETVGAAWTVKREVLDMVVTFTVFYRMFWLYLVIAYRIRSCTIV